MRLSATRRSPDRQQGDPSAAAGYHGAPPLLALDEIHYTTWYASIPNQPKQGIDLVITESSAKYRRGQDRREISIDKETWLDVWRGINTCARTGDPSVKTCPGSEGTSLAGTRNGKKLMAFETPCKGGKADDPDMSAVVRKVLDLF